MLAIRNDDDEDDENQETRKRHLHQTKRHVTARPCVTEAPLAIGSFCSKGEKEADEAKRRKHKSKDGGEF